MVKREGNIEGWVDCVDGYIVSNDVTRPTALTYKGSVDEKHLEKGTLMKVRKTETTIVEIL